MFVNMLKLLLGPKSIAHVLRVMSKVGSKAIFKGSSFSKSFLAGKLKFLSKTMRSRGSANVLSKTAVSGSNRVMLGTGMMSRSGMRSNGIRGMITSPFENMLSKSVKLGDRRFLRFGLSTLGGLTGAIAIETIFRKISDSLQGVIKEDDTSEHSAAGDDLAVAYLDGIHAIDALSTDLSESRDDQISFNAKARKALDNVVLLNVIDSFIIVLIFKHIRREHVDSFLMLHLAFCEYVGFDLDDNYPHKFSSATKESYDSEKKNVFQSSSCFSLEPLNDVGFGVLSTGDLEDDELESFYRDLVHVLAERLSLGGIETNLSMSVMIGMYTMLLSHFMTDSVLVLHDQTYPNSSSIRNAEDDQLTLIVDKISYNFSRVGDENNSTWRYTNEDGDTEFDTISEYSSARPDEEDITSPVPGSMESDELEWHGNGSQPSVVSPNADVKPKAFSQFAKDVLETIGGGKNG